MKEGIMSNSFRTGVCHRTAPPLTSADIRTLRGKPAIKKTIKLSHSHTMAGTSSITNDEWIYYNGTCEEHYFFKNEQLVYWKQIPYNSDGANLVKKNNV